MGRIPCMAYDWRRFPRPNEEIAMDAVVKPWPKSSPGEKPTLSEPVRAAPAPVVPEPSREQALAAVRTLIAYAGDDPDREGLRDTPKRVIDTYEELYGDHIAYTPVDRVVGLSKLARLVDVYARRLQT